LGASPTTTLTQLFQTVSFAQSLTMAR